jgi:predicted dehydrogenase
METPAYRGQYRAGVIGHTGRGNYGHGLDLALGGLPGVDVIAVADPDEAGRREAVRRIGAAKGYADYRQMLEAERLDVVVVAPRHPDQHEAMLLAAIASGVRAIYCEKPFVRTLEEADRVLAAAEAHGTKIAVAHQNRAFPAPRLARRLVAEGRIGRLRALRAYGKQDRRGGGQDLMVLGTHLLDLMRWLAGNAHWCHARVCADGRDATSLDVRPGEEGVGLVMGDDIVAQYGFEHGITGSFETTQAGDGGKGNYFRLDLCGTSGIITIWSSATMPLYLYSRPFVLPDEGDAWKSVPVEPLPMPPGAPEGASTMHPANQLLVRDLLAAVEDDRRPLSSGEEARAALEMIMAVYASHVACSRVPLPLAQRTHPLEHWRSRA